MARSSSKWSVLRLAVLATAFASGVLGDDILQTIGFTNCKTNARVTVQKVDITYNNNNRTVTFDVVGTSTRVQNVTAVLNVTAYGNQIYQNAFNPCDRRTFVEQLCPVPAGRFAARGTQAIPEQFAKLVPAIAFQIPDIAAMATLELRSLDSNESVACIQSKVTNGKTASVPAVSYVAAGVAAAALVLTGVSAASAAIAGGGAALGGGVGSAASTAGGMGTLSPSFGEVVGWFQGMAMNGMLSVNYPPIYRSFTKNFAFSTGIIPWTQLQISIDDFRGMTGGNLTRDSVKFLQNATLVFPDGSTQQPTGLFKVKRAFEDLVTLAARQTGGITTSVNATDDGSASSQPAGIQTTVSGIQAYVEQLAVPQSNTFMTVLLIVAIIIAAIVVGVLLVKVVLEFWALFGNFPKALAGFRKHYWGSIARAITSLILLLYGIWVLYCIFQFTNGDSWAAKTLAGITLALFTGILIFFSFKIWLTARRLKQNEGDTSGLYDEKDIWVKYSLFYESYKKDYWWIFVPTIVYMFAKGCILAAADGHGMAQTIAQLIIEALLLVLLLWSRPFERRSGNIINIVIQVVRVLSVVCILVFVEEFGIAQTTQTITGVVLIAVQSALTGILAILIAWNAIIACCKENPHRKRRKEMEKLQRDMDNLTPLDARNSLLMDRPKTQETSTTFAMANTVEKAPLNRSESPEQFLNYPGVGVNANLNNGSQGTMSTPYRPLTPSTPLHRRDASRENLVMGAAPIARSETMASRQPTLPSVGYNQGPYGGNAGYGAGGDGYGQGAGYGQGWNSYGGGNWPYRTPSRGY